MLGGRVMRRLVVILFFLFTAAARAESWTPPQHDHDNNPLNNTPQTAINLGYIHQVDFNTPLNKQEKGKLGIVIGTEFDSADYYRFEVSANDWLLHIRLNEQPATTMFITITRRDGSAVYFSRGADHEDFTIPLSPDVYFLKVEPIARQVPMEYVLTIEPTLVPINGNAGTACANAPLLDGSQQIVQVAGSISPGQTDYYGVFFPGEAEPIFSRIGGRHFSVHMIETFHQERFVMQNGPTEKWPGKFDPGYYCFAITDATTVGNYKVTLGPIISQVYPGDSRQAATDLNWYDLGNLSRNGRYGQRRYINYNDTTGFPTRDLVVRFSKYYIFREWLGGARRSHFYRFVLPQDANIDLSVGRLRATVRGTIERADNTLVGVTSSSGTSLIHDYLPPQTLKTHLPAGEYVLHIELLGATRVGTPYDLSFFSAAASPPTQTE